MESTIVNYNPEEEFNNELKKLWGKAKGSSTAKKISKTATNIKKTVKREAKQRPLWKVFAIFLLLVVLAFGKNFLQYGLKGIFTFLMSMTIFPFMEAWANSKKGK